MEPEITLFSVIMLLGAAHGLFLALALINTRARNGTGHFFLALLTLTFAIDLGHEFLYQSNYLLNVLVLAFVDPVINLLYGPSFYLYVRVLTDVSAFKLTGKRWLHFLPIGIGITICVMLPELDAEQFKKLFYADQVASGKDEKVVLSTISGIAMASIISIGIYLVLSINRLVRHARAIRQQFSSIERINLNWLRNLLVAISILYFVLIFGGFFSQIFGLDENFNNLLYLMIVAAIYSMGYLGFRQPVIFTQSEVDAGKNSEAILPTTEDEETIVVLGNASKYKTSSLDADMSAALRVELQRHMETENPHLDSKLTLSQLAKQLGISSNYLSQVINEQFEKNFFDFINGYRVEEAKRMLADSANVDSNIISIAYDSGFNSKSAFYTAFKRYVGSTPIKYRASLA
ncbi:MAG: AraC family transcriptional regulator [Gammaproteobacteria bacterium]|nr:AraC family transcriptional regulator [Gammaproteobacteria bacterium]